ncbi:MAG: protein kinase [Gemmatimonadota bacterium]|nr:protein kinase [Gemmatimonadota bacterium]
MSDAANRLSAALAAANAGYRIERELGAGGMATVYLAFDEKHDRKVAIKVLKPELAAVLGAERFVVEIKTTAAMSHPHILPLFDSGTADGFLFYVMPYIQGETIREKLNRETQFGVDEAVRIAREVADALDYAHRHGVIHRDIKPENILLHDGNAMVMDFGIALAVSAAAGGRMTETGLSLGTPHYMSPEQATAEKEITARSDQYSLASVLYEMLAGQPPHIGGAAQQVIMKIITESAQPVAAIRRTVPTNVSAALAKALEKLPADRFESAKFFADALANPQFAAAAPGSATASTVTPRQWIRNRYSQLAIAVVGLLAAGLGWQATRVDGRNAAPPALIAFTVMDSVPSAFDVADDGTIAYVSRGKVFVRRPGAFTATELAGIDSVASAPVFSPDGRAIAVAKRVAGNSELSVIVRVPTAGGAATPLFTGAGGFPVPMAWSQDGWIYADETPPNTRSVRLVRFRETGGKAEEVFPGVIMRLLLLPGNRALVGCTRNAGQVRERLIALDLASGDTSQVADNACDAAWSPTGHLLVTDSASTLRALPFDPATLRVTGEPVAVRDNVYGLAGVRVTPDGALLYVHGRSATAADLVAELVDLDGRRAVLPIGSATRGAFSPDGKLLAYTRDGGVWTYDLNLGTNRRITSDDQAARFVIWSNDGKRLIYNSARGTAMRAAEGDTNDVLVGGTGSLPWQELTDGTIIATGSLRGERGDDIVALHPDSGGRSRTILGADLTEWAPSVSADGRWLAYLTNEPSPMRVVVRTWPGLERMAVLAESASLSRPAWSADGKTLYYTKGGRLMAASLAGRESLAATAHRVAVDSVIGLVSAHPDGRRFLVTRRLGASPNATRPLVGITGWLADFRRTLAAEQSR